MNGIQIIKIIRDIKEAIRHTTPFNLEINHQVDFILDIKCHSKTIRITDQIQDQVTIIKVRIATGTPKGNHDQTL